MPVPEADPPEEPVALLEGTLTIPVPVAEPDVAVAVELEELDLLVELAEQVKSNSGVVLRVVPTTPNCG